jgi:uncharacterized damage-inducible protein DinB
MDLARSTVETYVRLAGRQMIDVAARLGDDRVNLRPPGPNTNSVAALITHCCGVSEFWLGCVGLGRGTTRDRDAEFVAVATVVELRNMVEAMLDQIAADIRSLDGGDANLVHRELASTLEDGDSSDAALVLHVLEELFQHLGQMELTADALT